MPRKAGLKIVVWHISAVENCCTNAVQVFRAQQLRHPAAAAAVGDGSSFVPNDVELGGNTPAFMLLTGPNMGGNSIFLRQVEPLTHQLDLCATWLLCQLLDAAGTAATAGIFLVGLSSHQAAFLGTAWITVLCSHASCSLSLPSWLSAQPGTTCTACRHVHIRLGKHILAGRVQVCLAAIMAQVGAWVPAASLTLTPADALFVRSGARDAIMSGQVQARPMPMLGRCKLLAICKHECLVIWRLAASTCSIQRMQPAPDHSSLLCNCDLVAARCVGDASLLAVNFLCGAGRDCGRAAASHRQQPGRSG